MELRVRADAAHQVLQHLVARHSRAQRLAVDAGDLALVILGESLRFLGGARLEVEAHVAGVDSGRRELAVELDLAPDLVLVAEQPM